MPARAARFETGEIGRDAVHASKEDEYKTKLKGQRMNKESICLKVFNIYYTAV